MKRIDFLRLCAASVALAVVPAAAQQPAPPITPPAVPSVAPPAAVIPPAADGKVMVVGSVVQLRSGGPKMTVVELSASSAAAQWFQAGAGFKKESFPLAALKLVDSDDEDEDEDDDEDDEDEDKKEE